MTEIAVTGIGLLSPLGTDVSVHARALTSPDPPAPTDGVVADVPARELVGARALRRVDRVGRMAIVAATLALRDAASADPRAYPADRVGLGWSTAYGSLSGIWDVQQQMRAVGLAEASPLAFSTTVLNHMAGTLSIIHKLQGPVLTFCHLGTCGLDAVAWGARTLRRGRADMLVVGGAEERVGPGTGEAAAALVLERVDDAQRRGVPVLARLQARVVAQGEAEHIAAKRSLAPVVGASSVVPLMDLIATVSAGELPATVAARGPGGGARVVSLQP